MTPNYLVKASGFKDFRHIPLGLCSGFKAKRHNFSFPFFSFYFSFLFFLFFFGKTHWSFYSGGPDLLKVVKSTRLDFCRA